AAHLPRTCRQRSHCARRQAGADRSHLERASGNGNGPLPRHTQRRRDRGGYHLHASCVGEQGQGARSDRAAVRRNGPALNRAGHARPTTPDHDHDPAPHGAEQGCRRWVFATNRKDIGTMYRVFSPAMLLEGGALALLLRTELFAPGLQFFRPELFNQFTTMHGLIMIFGSLMPAFVVFANWMIPLQIGASDMAFARMNNFSFWLLPIGAILFTVSFFVPGGANAAGWTMYAPLSLQMGPGMDFTIFAVHILGASSIMGAINIIVTVLNMRAPGMTLMKMPLFCWTWLITAYLLLAIMPVLAAAVTMLLTDRHFGTAFFNA